MRAPREGKIEVFMHGNIYFYKFGTIYPAPRGSFLFMFSRLLNHESDYM